MTGEIDEDVTDVFFLDADGQEIKVEYTFVYVRDGQGAVKIQLHHSALPYQG